LNTIFNRSANFEIPSNIAVRRTKEMDSASKVWEDERDAGEKDLICTLI